MEYACPVCGSPEVDRGHLANHLAFTALLRGGEHEVWLDEHVPDWEDLDEAGLSEALDGLADVALRGDEAIGELDGEAFDASAGPDAHAQGAGAEPPTGDRTGPHNHDHDHDPGRGHGPGHDESMPPADGLPDEEILEAETEAIVEEAKELTRRRREAARSGEGDDGAGETGEATDADSGENADDE